VTPAAPSDDAVRTLAAEVLARSEYAQYRTLESDLVRNVLERIARLLAWLDGLWTTNPALYVALFVGLTVLAAALLAHVVWSVRVALASTAPLPPAARGAAAPDLAAEAAALAERARFLEAAHTLQLACLGTLLSGGALELERHEPNRTLRARLLAARGLPEAERREFLELLDRLEARWFRDRRPAHGDRELFAAWRALHRRLRAAAAAK
jgi:hypothetical protein